MVAPETKNLIFRRDDEKAFFENWRLLTADLKTGPRYAVLSIKRFLIVAEERGRLEKDESFILMENSKPVAAAFLPIEKTPAGRTVSFGGGYTLAPIFKNQTIAKKVFSFIDEIAEKNNVSKIMFHIDPFDSAGSFNYLEKYGFLNASILTYFIDISVAGDLLRHCRKGHVCDIKKIAEDKRFETAVYDKNNFSAEAHEEYRLLHKKCSGGKATRSKESFDNQFEGLKQGEAILVGLKFEGRPVAYAYFEMLNGKATYASGADDPELADFPLYHSLIFTAMNDLRKRGVKLIELSQPAAPSAQFDYYPDEKQLNIAAFKRGFGGRLADFHRGVKYFSKKAFAEDMENFGKNYSRYIKEK